MASGILSSKKTDFKKVKSSISFCASKYSKKSRG